MAAEQQDNASGREGSEGVGSEHVVSGDLASDHIASDHVASEDAGAGDVGFERAGSEHGDSEQAGSEQAGSERAGSERAGSERAGSEQDAADHAGPGRTGSDRALPRLVAASVGAAVEAVDALTELGVETVQAAVARTRAVERGADRRYHEAARRGDAVLGRALAGVGARLDQAVTSVAAWTDREIVRRVAESMTPYLIDDLVPRVIDGVMPKIREDVVPAVIEDLADDDRIQTMVAMQSRGMVSKGVTEVRHASAGADDRVEAALRKVFGRQGPDV